MITFYTRIIAPVGLKVLYVIALNFKKTCVDCPIYIHLLASLHTLPYTYNLNELVPLPFPVFRLFLQ